MKKGSVFQQLFKGVLAAAIAVLIVMVNACDTEKEAVKPTAVAETSTTGNINASAKHSNDDDFEVGHPGELMATDWCINKIGAVETYHAITIFQDVLGRNPENDDVVYQFAHAIKTRGYDAVRSDVAYSAESRNNLIYFAQVLLGRSPDQIPDAHIAEWQSWLSKDKRLLDLAEDFNSSAEAKSKDIKHDIEGKQLAYCMSYPY